MVESETGKRKPPESLKTGGGRWERVRRLENVRHRAALRLLTAFGLKVTNHGLLSNEFAHSGISIHLVWKFVGKDLAEVVDEFTRDGWDGLGHVG